MKKAIRVFGMALMIMAGGSLTGLAASYTAAMSGDWVVTNTWNSTNYPSSGDTAIINASRMVTLTNNETVSNVGTITLGNTTKGTLTLSNSLTRLSTTNMTMSVVGSTLNILGGAQLTTANSTLGWRPGSDGTIFVASGGGSLWSNNSGMTVQRTATSMTISSNATVYIGGGADYGYGAGDNSNSFLVTGAGSTLQINGLFKVGRSGSFNSLIVTNGGTVKSVAGVIGDYAAGSFNYGIVSGPGSSWDMGGSLLDVGIQFGITGNWFRVEQGGVVSNITTLSVGKNSTSTVLLNNALLTSGGLIEVTIGITVGAALSTGNTLTNSGGILQFTTATPTITVGAGAGNAIVMDSGTLSYRSASAAVNLTNNWGTTYVGKFTWAPNSTNTLRLVDSTATNSLGFPYEFNTGKGGTNYANLVMLGASAFKGSGITIGAGGSMLVSNGTVNISGLVTNYGTLRFANSAVTFANNVVLEAGCINAVVSTNQLPMTVQGVLTLNGGTVNLPAGLGATDSFTLFTSPNTILGNVSSLSVSPNSHRAVLSDDSKSIVVRPRQPGFVFIVD